MSRRVGAAVLLGVLVWAGTVGPAGSQTGSDPDAEAVDDEVPSSTAPDAEPPLDEDAIDDNGSGETPTPEPEVVSGRPTTTPVESSVVDSESSPDVDSGDQPQPSERIGSNPLLVAGPPDGRRQLTPDPPDAGDVDVDQSSTTVQSSPETTDDAEVVVRRVVWGLVALAVVLTALAVYYWWITRPAPRPYRNDAKDDEPNPARASRSEIDEEGYEPDGPEGTVDPWLTDSTSKR